MLQGETTKTPLTAVLGPAHGRYFAEGYREVRYEVGTVREDPIDDCRAHAVVTALYPQDWSRGRDGSARTPHLSSVDAIALPLIVLERLAGPARLSSYWVERVELRAPTGPRTDLASIPLVLDVEGVVGETDLSLTADTGGMRTRLALRRSAAGGPERGDDGTPSVYSEGFRHVGAETALTPRTVDEGVGALHDFRLRPGAQMPALSGVEAAFSPAVSAIDLLVTMGQMTQATIYQSMPVEHRRGELWMRSMTIDICETPRPLPSCVSSSTRVTRHRVLDRDGRRIHDISAESQIEALVHARASLAYVEPPPAPSKGSPGA